MSKKALLAITSCLALAACGGSGGDSSGSTPSSSITPQNAKSVTRAVLQQITGTSQLGLTTSSARSVTASNKSTIRAGVVIEQNLQATGSLDLNSGITPNCGNSNQPSVIYSVSEDISLDCDFTVHKTSQLTFSNNAIFTVNGTLTLVGDTTATGNISLTADNLDLQGQLKTDQNIILNSTNAENPPSNCKKAVQKSQARGNLTISNGANIDSAYACAATNEVITVGSIGNVDIDINEATVSNKGTLVVDNQTLNANTAQSITLTSFCTNKDGSAIFGLDDANKNQILDLGERNYSTYSNCQISNMIFLDGQQSITVSQLTPSYKAKIENDNFTITNNGKGTTVNGIVDITMSQVNDQQVIRIAFTNFSETIGINTFTIHNGFVETRINGAQYEISQSNVVSNSAFIGKITFKTESPLKGSISNGLPQTPVSGQLRATADDGSFILIDANDGDNDADTFNLTISSDGTTTTTVERWSQL